MKNIILTVILCLSRFLSYSEKRPYDYYEMGLYYKSMNKNDSAVLFFNKAIEMKNDFALAYFERGNLKYKLKNYTGAINDFKMSSELASLGSIEIVKAKIALKNLDGAFLDCCNIIEIDSYNEAAFSLRSEISFQKHDYISYLIDKFQALLLYSGVKQFFCNSKVWKVFVFLIIIYVFKKLSK